MRFGLTDSQELLIKNLLIKPLTPFGVKVFVFGSRSRGDHHPFSDLDILIVDSKQIPFQIISLIEENFEESKLPFKIDLVLDSSLANSYRKNVEQEKIEF